MSHDTSFKFSYGPRTIAPGGQVVLKAIPPDDNIKYIYKWKVDSGSLDCEDKNEVRWSVPEVPSFYKAGLTITHQAGKQTITDVADMDFNIEVTPGAIPEIALRNMERGLNTLGNTFNVRHEQSVGGETDNQALWVTIRNRTKAIGFARYSDFIDLVLCQGLPIDNATDCSGTNLRRLNVTPRLPKSFHGVDAYELLKTATEIFLLLQCGVKLDESLHNNNEEALRLKNWADVGFAEAHAKLVTYLGAGRLPYIDRIIGTVFQDQEFITSPYCVGVLTAAADCPCLLELIWSYWHEEGGLVQTLNAISMRFQNKRGIGDGRDPLGQLEIAPLRPLNNLLWGYVQDERDRLTISRRSSEYQHHYGFTLMGKAVPKFRSADSRSKFLEAFHTLLYRAWTYYQEVADTHVVPDGFPLLNSLKEVHMLLAEGAHNQFGDLPWTSRVEMLIQQWLLARPEMQDFLRGRAMVPYKEAWMGPADTMKKLQGWTDVPVTHFRDLGVYGEQLLLSVRYDDWIDDARTEDDAKNWADYWKQEAQGYIHAYRAATGVDLTNAASSRERIDARMPAVHLNKRQRQQSRPLA